MSPLFILQLHWGEFKNNGKCDADRFNREDFTTLSAIFGTQNAFHFRICACHMSHDLSFVMRDFIIIVCYNTLLQNKH